MNPQGSGFDRYNVTAIGTTVVRSIPTFLHSITPEVSVGTVTLYDSATAAGTSTANRVFGLTGGTANSQCFTNILDIQFKNGIVATSYGTPTILLAIS